MRVGIVVALAAALAVVGAVPDAVGSTNTEDFRAADKDQDGVVSPAEFKLFLHPDVGSAEVRWCAAELENLIHVTAKMSFHRVGLQGSQASCLPLQTGWL